MAAPSLTAKEITMNFANLSVYSNFPTGFPTNFVLLYDKAKQTTVFSKQTNSNEAMPGTVNSFESAESRNDESRCDKRS
jgi:hypothetical protein